MEHQESELIDLELVARRVGRTEYLIAQFVDGYAAGWQFAVPEAFKESLDIRLTPKTLNKVVRQVWTQGQNFSFKQGDLLHNSRTAYDDFQQYLNGINPVSFTVLSSTPSGFETRNTYAIKGSPVYFQKIGKRSSKEESSSSFRVLEQTYDTGEAILAEYRPNAQRTALMEVKQFPIKQDQLVCLLQTGRHFETTSGTWVDFRYGEAAE